MRHSCELCRCDKFGCPHTDTIAGAKAQGAAEERARVVHWLNMQGPTAWMLAHAIAHGDHIKQETKPNE